jgi:hypothetical protein
MKPGVFYFHHEEHEEKFLFLRVLRAFVVDLLDGMLNRRYNLHTSMPNPSSCSALPELVITATLASSRLK